MIAHNMETYIKLHSTLVIINGEPIKRYKDGLKTCEKFIERCRKGKCNSKMYIMETLELCADNIEADARK